MNIYPDVFGDYLYVQNIQADSSNILYAVTETAETAHGFKS